MLAKLCNGDLRYVCQFLHVSCHPVPSKVLPNAKLWSGEVNCVQIHFIKGYMYGYHVILQCGGRWKCLDVALQAGGNFRIWSDCWNCYELVALSGQIVVIGNCCMVGVEMKIHRFDMI